MIIWGTINHSRFGQTKGNNRNVCIIIFDIHEFGSRNHTFEHRLCDVPIRAHNKN